MSNVITAAAAPAPITRTLRDYVARWLHDKLVGIVRRSGKHGLVCDLTVNLGETRTVHEYRRYGGSWYLPADEVQADYIRGRLCSRDGDDCDGCREVIAEGGAGCARHARPVLVNDLTITGGLPTLNGWTLLGALDWQGADEITVRTAPGQAVPARYYVPGARPTCDHCEVNRARKNCYVIAGPGGEVRQVGAQCLADYVRSADAERCADLLVNMWAALDSSAGADEDEGCMRYRAEPRTALGTWVAMAAAVVRCDRRYVSKAQTERRGGMSTGQKVSLLVHHGDTREGRELARGLDLEVTPADTILAQRAIAWAAATFTREGNHNEFEHNLGTIARLGYVDGKAEGTAGYMAEAYKRTLAPAAKPPPACHLSAEVGERVTFDAEVVRVSSYDSAWGTTFITVLRRLPTGTVSGLPVQDTPDAGANVVWKSKETIWTRGHGQLAADGSMPAWGEGSWVPAATGARVTVKATVKAHGTYKGTPQTEVTRLSRECDGWGYAAEAGTPEAELSARAIAEGRNRPQVKAAKPRVRKGKAAPVAEVAPVPTPAELGDAAE